MDGFPVRARHIGPDGCGEVAFFLTHRWTAGEPLRAATVRMPDGHQPKATDRIVCGACGKELPEVTRRTVSLEDAV